MASKAIEFGEITQIKSYYAVQGHSRSPMSVPIESTYATSYQWLILTSYLVSFQKLSQIIVQLLDKKRSFCFFEPPLGA